MNDEQDMQDYLDDLFKGIVMKDSGHNWSGWPGAYCINCGQEQFAELLMAEIPANEIEYLNVPCPKGKQ